MKAGDYLVMKFQNKQLLKLWLPYDRDSLYWVDFVNGRRN